MGCSDTLEGKVRQIKRTERRASERHLGPHYSFSTTRIFHDVECLIGAQPAYLSLQAGTALFLKSGDQVLVAGRIVEGTFVAFALRNLTDGSIYCWGTEGGRYRRFVKRIDRGAGWVIACLAAPLIVIFALETWPTSPAKAVFGALAGAIGAWLTHKLVTLLNHFYPGGYLPGDAETESSAQALIQVREEDAHRIIWI